MLNWISSKLKQGKTDHPLGSEAGITEFLDSLTPGRPETNLLELAEWLGDPEKLTPELPPEYAIRAIMRLDEAGVAAVAATWQQFLSQDRVDHYAEQKLKSLDTYYQAARLSYWHCLNLLTSNPGAAGNNLGGAIALLAQRSIAALSGRLRIMHIRYRTPDAAWWDAVGAALQSAQAAGVINLKQRTYPEDLTPSSPWLEYLINLFFEVAPLGNLVPQQMDLLYRLLRWLEPHFMVQDSYSTHSAYCIRLNQPAVPVKVTEALPADPNLVYFGPGLAYGQLIRLRSTLKHSGELPDWMTVSQCPFDRTLAVIDALIMHWSERPPERRFVRKRKEAKLLVASGFSQIRRLVAFSEFARSGRKLGYTTHLEMLKFERSGFADATEESAADEEKWKNATPLQTIELLETRGDRQMMDEWSLRDVSETGLGAIVPFLKPWIVIGAYVGYRLDDKIDWQIGILRRIHRVETGHPSVGVEVLPEIPRCAQILPLDLQPGADPWAQMNKEAAGDQALDAVVLSMSESRMLIPTGVFAEDRVLALLLSGSRVPVRLESIVHQSGDCDCVQYELCEQARK